MTIREVRPKARPLAAKQQLDRLIVVLLERAAAKEDQCCAVCGLTSLTNEARFVIPLTYIATCLVTNSLSDHLDDLPLKTAFLCHEHRDSFDALFVDPTDARWDVERLERRAEVLGGVMVGRLLVFGGHKAQKVVQEFQAAIVALKQAN